MILVVFHTVGINEKKKLFIMKKKKYFFGAVGWKSYCSRLWSWAGAGRWARRWARRARAGGRAGRAGRRRGPGLACVGR